VSEEGAQLDGRKVNSKGSKEGESNENMLPPSSSSYTPPVLSPYMHHYMAAYAEQRVPPPPPSSSTLAYDSAPRKRHHRSPSDPMRNSSLRASVLRDGSKPERESPLSLAFSQHPPPSSPSSQPPYQSPRYDQNSDTSASAPTPTQPSSVTFDRSAAVESDTPPDVWRPSSCPEGMYTFLLYLLV
jgi:hypothetical protein